MRKIVLILAASFLLSFFSAGQPPRKNSLLVAEYVKNKKAVGDSTHLARYNFIDGLLSSKDTLFSAPTVKGQYKGSYVRYDLGTNFIYRNRYVISGTGNVIDLQTRSLIMEESDELKEISGDSLIFYRNNIITGTGYLVCDLKKRTYKFVKDKKFRNVKGRHSPDHRWGLEISEWDFQKRIVLYNKRNRKETIVNNCGGGTFMSTYSSARPNVPVYWLTNRCFLYAAYYSSGAGNDATAVADIHKFDIEDRSDELITRIDSVPGAVSRSGFSTDREEKIIFQCAKGSFEIDLDKKQAIPYTMRSAGDNFSVEIEQDKKLGRSILFQGSEIGRMWCLSYEARTTPGFIGLPYSDTGANLGYPKGVRVWNTITSEWTEIQIPWMSDIIGWVENN